MHLCLFQYNNSIAHQITCMNSTVTYSPFFHFFPSLNASVTLSFQIHAAICDKLPCRPTNSLLYENVYHLCQALLIFYLLQFWSPWRIHQILDMGPYLSFKPTGSLLSCYIIIKYNCIFLKSTLLPFWNI